MTGCRASKPVLCLLCIAMVVVSVVVMLIGITLSQSADPKTRVVGSTAVFLDNTNKKCFSEECNLANMINDAMVEEWVKRADKTSWTLAAIAVSNAGSFQASIDEKLRGGAITYGDLLAVQPYNNTFDVVELQGKRIKEILELSATKHGQSGFMHWSGLRVTYDLARPVNERAVEVSVRCRKCRVPVYRPLHGDTWYHITMHSYLVLHADDGYNVITNNYKNRTVGRLDNDVVIDYLMKKSPVSTGIDGRLRILHPRH